MTPVFAFAFSTGMVVLLVVLMLAMPAITPATVPLGVAVPPTRTTDPAVRTTVARYRIGQIAVGVIAIAAGAALLVAPGVAAILVPTFVFLVLSVVVLVVSRRRLIAAKRAGDWYAGVPVQRSAEVTAPAHHHPPIVWGIIAVVAFAVAFGIGTAVYPSLPDPIPVHFGIGGTPDRFAPKSVWAVFGVLLVAFTVAALLFVLAVVVSRVALRATPGDDPDGALARASQRRGVLAALLAQMTAAIAVSLSAMSVLIWLAPPAAATITGLVVTLVLVLGVVAVAVVRFRRIALPASGTPGAVHAGPAAPDDDSHWKGGIIYVNRDDPAIWVPRRFGMGWTINLGRPAGIVVGVATILVIVGVVVTLLLTAAHGR